MELKEGKKGDIRVDVAFDSIKVAPGCKLAHSNVTNTDSLMLAINRWEKKQSTRVTVNVSVRFARIL